MKKILLIVLLIPSMLNIQFFVDSYIYQINACKQAWYVINTTEKTVAEAGRNPGYICTA